MQVPAEVSQMFASVHLVVSLQTHSRVPLFSLQTGFPGVHPVSGEADVPPVELTIHVRHVPSAVLQTLPAAHVPFKNQEK